MFGNRRLAHVGLAVLLGAASACGGSQQKAQGIDFDPAGYEGFEATRFNLLSAYCTVNTTTDPDTLVLTVNDETLYLYYRALDGKVVANAQKADGSECTAAATDRISITGTALKNDIVIIDHMFGQFGIATASSDPLIAVSLGTAAADGADVLQIRATSGADAITLGTDSQGTSFVNFQTVGAKTARNYVDVSILGVEAITVSAGPGADNVNGMGGTAIGLTAGESSLDGAISLTVYGGDGDDTLQAGAASSGTAYNVLSGGAGNDYFPQANVLADDTITGGDGVDTVDYSAKSGAVNVTIGKGTPATYGSALLTAVAKADIVDNAYFEVDDADSSKRYAFQTQADATIASALITFTDVGVDGQTFLIDDGTDSMTFCLSSGGGTTCAADSAGVTLRVTIGGTAAETAANLAAAISANAGEGQDLSDLQVTYVATEDNLTVASITPGDTNLAITEDVADATAVVTDGVNGFTLSVANAGAVVVDISADTTAAQVASTIYTTVNGNKAGLDISLTAPTADVVAFANTAAGALPDILTEAVADADFVVTNTPGSALKTRDDDGATGETDDIDTDVENVIGSAHNDLIDASLATALGHVIMGLDGNDTLKGSVQTDAVNYIWGGKGNDTLVGGIVADFLYGSEGNDSLQGKAGNDTMDGGGANCIAAVSVKTAPIIPFVSSACTTTNAKAASVGNDTVDYSDRSNAVTVNLTPANLAGCAAKTPSGVQGETGECDIIVMTGSGATAVANVKNIRGGSAGDTLTGDASANVIWGGAGGDTISGGIGNDTIFGEDGNDIVYGCLNTSVTLTSTQSDNDILFGGIGNNQLFGEIGLDTLDATVGTNTGNAGCDTGDIILGSGPTLCAP